MATYTLSANREQFLVGGPPLKQLPRHYFAVLCSLQLRLASSGCLYMQQKLRVLWRTSDLKCWHQFLFQLFNKLCRLVLVFINLLIDMYNLDFVDINFKSSLERIRW